MNESTNNTAQGGNTTPEQGGKTFSQDDVNRIISERLSKEKTKSEADLVKKEQELAQRELALVAKETLSIKGLPVELFEALNCTSKEAMEKSINIIEEAFSKTERAPIVFRGAVPASGSDIELGSRDEANIRDAMGLSRK